MLRLPCFLVLIAWSYELLLFVCVGFCGVFDVGWFIFTLIVLVRFVLLPFM